MKRRHRTAPSLALAVTLAAALVGAALPAAPARAQSAGDVLTSALDKYESRMKGVDDYTITFSSSVMAGNYTVFYKKKMVNGHAVFVTPDQDTEARTASEWGNPYEVLPKIAQRARLKGHETVDGHDAYVIQVDDLSGLDFGQESLGKNADARLDPKSMTMYVDSKDYLIRRMQMEGTITREGKTNPVHMDAHMKDYREIQGLMQPYKMDITMTGLNGAISDEDRAQARQTMDELQKRLDSMPADQRKMMEQMLGPQMKRMQEMLESGKVDVSIQVQDVKVNAGPPKEKLQAGGSGKGSGGSDGGGR